MEKGLVINNIRSEKTSFPVLVYHQIGRETSLDYLMITKKMFVEQIHYIRKHYHPIHLSALLEKMSRSEPITPDAIAITFDDGYADTFSEAFPVLREYKIPATLFITTGFVDGLKDGPRKAKMLSWKMIRQMMLSGIIECGAHTVTHPNLRHLSLKKARCEIVESKKRIEEKIESPVKTFAYPYGNSRSFSKQIQMLVQEAGYLGACTTLPGQNSSSTNPFSLRRISLTKSQIRFFALQFSELSNGILPAHEISEFRGINKKVLGLWRKRYQWLEKHLKRDNFLWKSGKDAEAVA